MFITFSLTVFAWIFFRAENMEHAWQYASDMLVGLTIKSGYLQTINLFIFKIDPTVTLLLFIFLLIEWMGREGSYAISHTGLQWKRPYRHAFYYALVIAILWFGGKEQQFIYFQF